MGRYIDAEALKVSINTAFWSEIGKIINSAPSIDIVRCKECVFRNQKYLCQVIETDDDDFCSYGEREGK